MSDWIEERAKPIEHLMGCSHITDAEFAVGCRMLREALREAEARGVERGKREIRDGYDARVEKLRERFQLEQAAFLEFVRDVSEYFHDNVLEDEPPHPIAQNADYLLADHAERLKLEK